MNTQAPAGKGDALEPQLLTYAQAAQYLNISQRFLRNLVASGVVKQVRLGRRALFRRKNLDAFIEASA